jgi:CspA family cold shock protein
MVEGTVKWFDKKKGYGFIALDGNPDVFVHYSNFAGREIKTLNEGDVVSFEVVQGEKGPRADKVTLKTV